MMTMRKILAVVLCVCAVLSVMAVVTKALPPPPETETTTTATTTTKGPGDQINDTWEKIKVWFEPLFKFSFQGFSQLLWRAFYGLLMLVGLN